MQAFKKNAPLVLGALGVVYGDIGTSPLYTLAACFDHISVDTINILGILSLIFWTLILVVSTCYVTVFLRANNDGEGGVLALLGLLKKHNKTYNILFFVGIFGAGLLISDGMLTPAISVISAIEGLIVVAPDFKALVIPITIAILLSLFLCQRFGTEKIGKAFGPVLLLWFITIGLLGLRNIIHAPLILEAINPYYAIHFFYHNGFKGWLMLGSVFLCITGAEAMYADLGQFGKKPIRLGWFCIVLPGLLLCFFGEGAYLLSHPEAISNPFYLSAPTWCAFPLLIVATLATIIASQSIISASYSLTKQGILLGVIPRLRVIQTSSQQRGQIYVPKVNFVFAIGTVALVLFFKSSNALTNAYGIAINFEMIIMATLIVYLARVEWQWSGWKIIRVFALFVLIDLAFLSSNLFKIHAGGWVPLLSSLACMLVMLTWHRGMVLLQRSFVPKTHVTKPRFPVPNSHHLSDCEAILITNTYDHDGACFLNYFDRLQSRPTRWLMVNIEVHPVPHIRKTERFTLNDTHSEMKRLTLHVGFMDSIHVPHCLQEANQQHLLPFELNLKSATYFIEDIAISHQRKKHRFLMPWQQDFFIFMFKNTSGTLASLEFLKLPQTQTVVIGAYAEL